MAKLNGHYFNGRAIKVIVHKKEDDVLRQQGYNCDHRVFVSGLKHTVTKDHLSDFLKAKSISNTGIWITHKRSENSTIQAYVNCASEQDFDQLMGLNESEGPGERMMYCAKANPVTSGYDPEHPFRVTLRDINYLTSIAEVTAWIAGNGVEFEGIIIKPWNNSLAQEEQHEKRHKGKGYIDCSDEQSRDKLITLSGTEFDGRKIRLQTEVPHPDLKILVRTLYKSTVEVEGMKYVGYESGTPKGAERLAAEIACREMKLIAEDDVVENGSIVNKATDEKISDAGFKIEEY